MICIILVVVEFNRIINLINIMTTTFLAQAIGILFIVVGLSLAFERKMVMDIFKELFKHRVLTYIWGMITLIISVIMILQHNIWSGTTELAVTILGWYLFLEALVYVFLPQKHLSIFLKWLRKKTVYYSLAAVFLLIGAYFFSYGFIFS